MNNYKKTISQQLNLKNDLNTAIENFGSFKNNTFYTLLFVLLMKSDEENYKKLKDIFPEQVKMFEKYKKFGMQTDDSDIIIDKNFK